MAGMQLLICAGVELFTRHHHSPLLHPLHSPLSFTHSTPPSPSPAPLPPLLHSLHSPLSFTHSLPSLLHPLHSPLSFTHSTPPSPSPTHSPLSFTRSTPPSPLPTPLCSLSITHSSVDTCPDPYLLPRAKGLVPRLVVH